MTTNIVRNNGFLALYNGISATILRQATFSTTRFGCYEVVKESLVEGNEELPFVQKIALAGGSGFLGGFVGTPADLVNVRMQNDSKLPVESRRNYKHCFEALGRIMRTEGNGRLFAGWHMASTRGMLVTVGQIAFYEEIKYRLLHTPYFKDNLATHFTASLSAGVIATCITMPIDVVKTRLMNAKPGEYSGILHCAKDIMKVGPSGFFKGFLPSFARLGPHTILIFMFLEQLKKLF